MKIFILVLITLSLFVRASAEEAAPIPPKNFETPVEASDTFIAAAKSGDTAALLAVFGDKHKELVGTAEPERDKELRTKVAAMAIERRRFRFNDENSVTMVIGAEAWSFPIPIVKTDKGWHFDTATGMEEIVTRRIGENELNAIATLHTYADAQRQHAAEPRDDSKVRQFARKFQSASGKADGLQWPADLEITDSDNTDSGYHFKILTQQGEAAPAGKYDYIINGHFIGGFALIAWPLEYGKTGVMSFIVNHYGDVYERDLGPETSIFAAQTTDYNPTKEWTAVEE
jgi:hypothetical protein